MGKTVLISVILVFLFSFSGGFKSSQLKNSRVKSAYTEKQVVLDKLLLKSGLDIHSLSVFIRAFKKERIIEVWGKDDKHTQYSLIVTYDFCETSGELGPKRRQGDLQIPEGFYHIDRFNPWSSFHLSLGINYPNSSDRILGYKANLGGDIFIHGSCATIGCIPITDDKIKEFYLFMVEARNNGQMKIPVHIFPGKLNDESWGILKTEYSDKKELLSFWENIRPGYLYFEKNKILPTMKVLSNGNYQLTY